MKITQNLETGKLEFHLKGGEVYNTDSYLTALSDFVSTQAIETLRHTKEYRKLVGRLDNLETQITELRQAQENEPISNNALSVKATNYFSSLDDISLSELAKIYLKNKELPQEVLEEFATHKSTNKSVILKPSSLVHQKFFDEILTRFSNRIQIYLDS
jgi:hypothetical protein